MTLRELCRIIPHLDPRVTLPCLLAAAALAVPLPSSGQEEDYEPIDSSVCADCHEAERPEAPHPATADCVSCHTHPDWAVVTDYDHQL